MASGTIKIKRDPARAKRKIDAYEAELVALFVEYNKDVSMRLGLPVRALAATDKPPFDIGQVDPALTSATTSLFYKGRLITRQAVKQNYMHGRNYADLQLKRLRIDPSFGFQSPDWRAIDILQSRNLSALKGITDEMNKQIVDQLSKGILAGEGMDKLAKRLSDRVSGIGIDRAQKLARYETMFSVNEASLIRYNQYGVDRLQRLESDDGRICPECLEHNNEIYTIEEARGVLPAHPGCRGCWAPAPRGMT